MCFLHYLVIRVWYHITSILLHYITLLYYISFIFAFKITLHSKSNSLKKLKFFYFNHDVLLYLELYTWYHILAQTSIDQSIKIFCHLYMLFNQSYYVTLPNRRHVISQHLDIIIKKNQKKNILVSKEALQMLIQTSYLCVLAFTLPLTSY